MPKKKFAPKGPKDPFDDLPAEFKDAVAAASRAAIRDKIATISLDQAELMEAKKKDTDLEKARETAREAGAIYREGTKMNKLKIEWAKRCLDDKGG